MFSSGDSKRENSMALSKKASSFQSKKSKKEKVKGFFKGRGPSNHKRRDKGTDEHENAGDGNVSQSMVMLDQRRINDARLMGLQLTENGRLHGKSQDRLKAFESSEFDTDGFTDAAWKHLAEPSVERFRVELTNLEQECNTSIQSAVEAHHTAFVKVCEGVPQLEANFQELRGMINNFAALTTEMQSVSMAPRDTRTPLPLTAGEGAGGPTKASGPEMLASQSEAVLSWTSLMQELDVKIAERSMNEAKELLNRGKEVLTLIQANLRPEEVQSVEFISWINNCHVDLDHQMSNMVPLLESQLADPLATPREISVATRLLAHALGRCPALARLLAVRSAELESAVDALARPGAEGTYTGPRDGPEVAAALSQLVFGTLGRTHADMEATFRDCRVEVSSTFMQWAVAETQKCGKMIKKFALMAPLTEPAGCSNTVMCVALALTFCFALENAHSICLAPYLHRELWPAVRASLQDELDKHMDELTAAVAQDLDDILTEGVPPSMSTLQLGTSAACGDVAEGEGAAALIPSALLAEQQLLETGHTLSAIGTQEASAALAICAEELFVHYAAVMHEQYAARYKFVDAPNAADARVLDGWSETLMNSTATLGEVVVPAVVQVMRETVATSAAVGMSIEGSDSRAQQALATLARALGCGPVQEE